MMKVPPTVDGPGFLRHHVVNRESVIAWAWCRLQSTQKPIGT